MERARKRAQTEEREKKGGKQKRNGKFPLFFGFSRKKKLIHAI